MQIMWRMRKQARLKGEEINQSENGLKAKAMGPKLCLNYVLRNYRFASYGAMKKGLESIHPSQVALKQARPPHLVTLNDNRFYNNVQGLLLGKDILKVNLQTQSQ